MMVHVTNNKVTYCRNLEYKTDLADARSPYSTVTKLHGRKVKSYELEEACSKLGLQTEDYKKYMTSIFMETLHKLQNCSSPGKFLLSNRTLRRIKNVKGLQKIPRPQNSTDPHPPRFEISGSASVP